MAPRFGYAPKGERSHGKMPRNRGRNTSFLAALDSKGMVGTMVVEGAINIEVLCTYLDEVLCPALHPGRVIVLDHLAAHKNQAVRERIEACGCRLLFLPAYSPDFNPIEHAFSKLKAFLRKTKARTQQALESAIAADLATLNAQDACGWFNHCQFPLAFQSS